jgi:uncharacterized iron-regulated membrane protein
VILAGTAALPAAQLAADATNASSGLGLLVVLALVVACVFLFRSLTKQLKKLPPTFDAVEPPRLPEPADPADDALAAARGEVPLADPASERRRVEERHQQPSQDG